MPMGLLASCVNLGFDPVGRKRKASLPILLRRRLGRNQMGRLRCGFRVSPLPMTRKQQLPLPILTNSKHFRLQQVIKMRCHFHSQHVTGMELQILPSFWQKIEWQSILLYYIPFCSNINFKIRM